MSSTLYDNSEKKKEKKLDIFNQIMQDLEKYTWSASQDEYEDYCDRKSYDIEKMTALEWWCQDTQRRHWSRLSHMILDIFSISAMSNESERVFSEAHHIISWERA